VRALESDRPTDADQKRGVIAIDTPLSQSLIGFVRDSGESGRHLVADVTNDFSVLTLTAPDDQPIARSKELLLVATAGAAVNTGQPFAEDGKTLAEWGQGPVLIEPVVGLVALRGLESPRAIRGQPLTPEGRPLGPPKPATRSKTGWEFQLGEPATTCWLLEVER